MKFVIKGHGKTEKSEILNSKGFYSFFVAKDARKSDIKSNIEEFFSVKVESVNVLKQKGRKRTFKGVRSQSCDRKKAYVKLIPGMKIDFDSLSIDENV